MSQVHGGSNRTQRAKQEGNPPRVDAGSLKVSVDGELSMQETTQERKSGSEDSSNECRAAAGRHCGISF